MAEDWLVAGHGLMLVGVTTCRFGRAVRLPEGDVPAGPGRGCQVGGVAPFVALRRSGWRRGWQDLSGLDLLAVQIDGIHLAGDLLLVAAVGIDGEGAKHPLGLVEGATENAAVVQALLDHLVERGSTRRCRLFIVDGAKALSKAIRRTFGRDTPIQRCQVHKARNIVERLPKDLHAPTRRRCGRPGNSTMPGRRRAAAQPGPPWSPARPASPRRSSRGSTSS